jgi:hypothetical protein
MTPRPALIARGQAKPKAFHKKSGGTKAAKNDRE